MSRTTIPLSDPRALAAVLGAYRVGEKKLRAIQLELFPSGAVVNVDSDRFRGVGVVQAVEDCPADHVAVRVESGNTWYYPIEHVTRNRCVKTWPRFVRRIKLPRAIVY